MIERAGGFVITFLIARTLGATSLGVYAVALAIYGLLAIAGSAGTTNFLIREIATKPEETGSYVVHLSILAAAVSSAVIGGALLIVPHLGYSHALTLSVSVVVLAILPTTLNSIQEAAFVAHGRVELETLTTLAGTLATIGASAYLLSRHAGIVWLVVAYVVVEYLVTVTYFVLISRFITRLPLEFHLSQAMMLLRGVKAFAASSALAALFSRPEVIVISLLSTERQAGLYSGAVKLAELWVFVPQVFMTNVFPLLARSHREGGERFASIQNAAGTSLLAGSLPVSVALFVLARPAIHLVYGGDFGGSVVPLQILAPTATLFALTSLLWRVLAAAQRQDVVLKVQLVSIVVRLGAAAALIPLFTSKGAAVAATASVLLNFLLLGWFVERVGAPFVPGTGGWRLLVISVALGAGWWLLGRIVNPWLLVPAAAAIYLGAAAWALAGEGRLLVQTFRSPPPEAAPVDPV